MRITTQGMKDYFAARATKEVTCLLVWMVKDRWSCKIKEVKSSLRIVVRNSSLLGNEMFQQCSTLINVLIVAAMTETISMKWVERR